MLSIGTSPPIGVNESCPAITAPQEASVVIVAKRAVLKMPNRVSFPSILPPAGSTPRAFTIGLPCDSADQQISTPATNITAIAAQTAQPCPCRFVARPKQHVRALGIAKTVTIWIEFTRELGFSN